jgi:hypothetical protein
MLGMLQGTDADSYSAGWIDLAISTHREGPAQGQLLCDLHQLVRLNQTQSNLVLLCLVMSCCRGTVDIVSFQMHPVKRPKVKHLIVNQDLRTGVSFIS